MPAAGLRHRHLNAHPRVERYEEQVGLRFVVGLKCEKVDPCHILLLEIDHKHPIEHYNITGSFCFFNVTCKAGVWLDVQYDFYGVCIRGLLKVCIKLLRNNTLLAVKDIECLSIKGRRTNVSWDEILPNHIINGAGEVVYQGFVCKLIVKCRFVISLDSVVGPLIRRVLYLTVLIFYCVLRK